MPVDFGVVMQCTWSASDLITVAETAEANGLDFVLISDHYLMPFSSSTVDSWTLLAAIAAKTSRIRIGTCVTPIPFRPPPLLAKIVSTVDQISKGRTILGVGAGWYKPEFEAFSNWSEDRVRAAKTLEGIELITKLWTSETPLDFNGKYFTVKGAILEPKPIQRPHPPLWFGTNGKYLLRKARELASGWVPPVPGISLDDYRQVASALAGSQVKMKFNGTLEHIRENIETYAEIGCDGGALSMVPPADLPSAIKRLAAEVMPSYG
jgi:alkanesulfonate monooxygenase SsuD/methylene tetrahydromethanopterin reductase-like flavin-dependent oxidoreductase (luciferase family)